MVNFRSLFFFLTVCASQNTSLFCIPQVTSLSNNSGPITGLNTITIHGIDFTGATSVKFGDQTISAFISNSGTAIQVTVPAGSCAGTVDISVLRNSETSPYTPEAQYTYQGGAIAYVTGKNTGVFSFDLTAQTEGNLILNTNSAINTDIPSAPTSPFAQYAVIPYKVAFLPNGQFAYVGDVISDNLLKLKSTTNSPITTTDCQINLGGNKYLLFPAASPDGKFVYVQSRLNNTTNPLTRGFFQIGTSSNHIENSIISDTTTLIQTNDTIVHPNNKYVYRIYADIGLGYNSRCVVYSVDDDADIASVALHNIPFSMMTPTSAAITPDGKFLYVTSYKSESPQMSVVLVLPIGPTFIPTPSTTSIPVAQFPSGIAISANGKYAIVTSQATNVITRITLSDNSTTTTNIPNYTLSPNPENVPEASSSVAVAISSDSKTAYILDYTHGNIALMDVETLTFSPTRLIAPSGYYTEASYTNQYTVVGSTAGIAISPDQAPVALFSASPQSPENPTTIIFDASKSVSPVGTVVKYDWIFGDGTTSTTTTPIVSHTYAALLPYDITLTVTNSGGTSTAQTFTGHTVSNQGSSRARLTKSLLMMLAGGSSGTSSSETFIPPQNFTGKVKKAKNHQFVLQTTWTPSTSSNVTSYEIFADNKLVAKISPLGQIVSSVRDRHVSVTTAPTGTLGITFDLSTSGYYKDHMRKYEKYLEGKYRVRAVYTNGCVSDFVLLKIK